MKDRIIALAGVFQAAQLARELARTGKAPATSLETSLRSLQQLDPDSVEEVYGGTDGLQLGFRTLAAQLGGGRRDMDILRYVVAMLHLERRLRRRRDLLGRIREAIEAAQMQAQHFNAVHPTMVARFADIYVKNVSLLRPRVVVRGSPLYLEQPRIVEQIRATLLAGVRSAMLWRQVGGSRLGLLLKRRSMAQTAEALADATNPAASADAGRH